MLRGKRVSLRSIEREDLFRLWEFNNDLEVELLGGGDPPIPQSLTRLEADFQQDSAKGGRDGARFAIDVGGNCIGQCALFDFNEANRTCQLGITIGDKNYWGRGYGREAVGMLVGYAFRYRNMRKVWLTVNGNNERAIKAYRACGFVEEGRLRSHSWNNGNYVDLLCMGILIEEWTPVKSEIPELPPSA